MDHYSLLNVPPNAHVKDITQSFRRLAREVHPDRNPAPDATLRFQNLQQAYAVLSDPRQRYIFDQQRHYTQSCRQQAQEFQRYAFNQQQTRNNPRWQTDPGVRQRRYQQQQPQPQSSKDEEWYQQNFQKTVKKLVERYQEQDAERERKRAIREQYAKSREIETKVRDQRYQEYLNEISEEARVWEEWIQKDQQRNEAKLQENIRLREDERKRREEERKEMEKIFHANRRYREQKAKRAELEYFEESRRLQDDAQKQIRDREMQARQRENEERAKEMERYEREKKYIMSEYKQKQDRRNLRQDRMSDVKTCFNRMSLIDFNFDEIPVKEKRFSAGFYNLERPFPTL